MPLLGLDVAEMSGCSSEFGVSGFGCGAVFKLRKVFFALSGHQDK